MIRALACVGALFCAGAIVGCSLERTGLAPGDGGPGIDAAGLDAGPLPDGGRDGSASCSPGSCDDGNACTDDGCDPVVGCQFDPNSSACDDGILCNGGDTCSAGACSEHDGRDPCPGASSCDAASDMCVGCAESSDCPGEMTGDWSVCAFPADACATGGTRSRTITSYSCDGGSCNPSERVEIEACTRVTTGTTCAPPVTGAYGTCAFLGPCALSGMRSRTVTTSTCAGGACTTATTTETDIAGCARSTDGTACGPVTSTDWGPCEGFSSTCDESGTETRMTGASMCSGGACNTDMSSESRACMRTTTGTMCGAPSCTDWSMCTRIPSRGCFQSRTCTTQQCVTGSCAAGVPAMEMQPCMGC